MIRSQTVWSRTLPGISSKSKPDTIGGAAQDPPTTAVPPLFRMREKLVRACSGERLARETTPSTWVSQAEISPCTTSTFASSSTRIDPPHQIDPTDRSDREGRSGCRACTCQRYPGKTDARAHIEDFLRGLVEPTGEEQRVADVPIIDPGRLVGADTAGLHRLGEKPVSVTIQGGDLGRCRFPPGPCGATGPDLVGWFHVKQARACPGQGCLVISCRS